MSALSGVSDQGMFWISILLIKKVDIALWDLKARKLGVPIYQLLGGKVRNKIKVYAWIGGDRPDDVGTAA